MQGIYKITNLVTNQVYIGQSILLKNRLINHRSRLKRGRHENSKLQRSYDKYGVENFSFDIIEQEEHMTREELNEKEIYYICLYQSNSEKGFNLTDGGQHNIVHVWTLDERKERSEKMKGSKNHFHGKTHTEETRCKLSKLAKSRTGKANPFYGKTHSDNWAEQRKAIYAEKKLNGWVDPKKGKISKSADEINRMKDNMPSKVSITVDNTEYRSISECSQILGIPRSTLRKRLDSPNFINYIRN